MDPIPRLNSALEGRYQIERVLGDGGMATVYLADDLRHERKVALKVLKPELAAVVGADRFLAEIKTTANLQHPHILPLFDSGEADGFLFYVMPWVEGESLREKLDREHQLPVDDAVRVAAAVASALDFAHGRGVVHRDVKPGNILFQGGQPVVGDFGIALAVGAGSGARMTETGLSLGTPYYMSPEQAVGDQHVGPRSDIYSLGCVLYEMLVGDPPYAGSTAQAVLGQIISAKAPVAATEHRPAVPAHVDAAIRKALEKVPADRFDTAADLSAALGNPGFRHRDGTARASAQAPEVRPWRIATTLMAVVSVLAVGALWVRSRPAPSDSTLVVSFPLAVGGGADRYLGGRVDAWWGWPASTSLALSPDGALLVYSAWELGSGGEIVSRLYLRRLEREGPTPLAGTEGASSPFFSPEGRWVGFLDDEGRLRRLLLPDGAPEIIAQDARADDGMLRGATWGESGTIVYGGVAGALYRVPADGGVPELLAEPDTAGGESKGLRQPHWLPGDGGLLFHEMRSRAGEEPDVLALDVATGERTTLLTNAADPRYLETGYLLFLRRGTLMAVGFDPDAVEVLGAPVVVLDDVMQALEMPNGAWESGAGQLAVSRAGHLAYGSGGVLPRTVGHLWRVGLDGVDEDLGLAAQPYGPVRVSHDGRRIAFRIDGDSLGLRVHDLDRGQTRTLNTGVVGSFEWGPEDGAIAFRGVHNGVRDIFSIPADDDNAQPEPLLPPSSVSRGLGSWSPQGVIAYLQDGDIWIQPNDREPAPFFQSAAIEFVPTFSPDGRWLAYSSNQSGVNEVYVRPYPGPGVATLVSNAGGFAQTWSRDGRRLFYLQELPSGERRMMTVTAFDDGELRPGRPVPVVEPWTFIGFTTRGYDVLPDGTFLGFRPDLPVDLYGGDVSLAERMLNRVSEIHVVLNWVGQLQERMGGS